MLGAVATGRLGTAVVAVLLPLLVLVLLPRAQRGRAAAEPGGPRWAGGLLLAVMTAFVPLRLGGLGCSSRPLTFGAVHRHVLLRVVPVVVVPPVLLLPWLPGLVARAARCSCSRPGCRARACPTAASAAWTCCCCTPAARGCRRWCSAAGLLLAALAGLLRRDRRRLVLLGWLAAVVCLGGALALTPD